MIEAKEADFSFIEFKVPRFSYNEENHLGSELKIGFIPTGIYYSKEGVYELNLKLHVSHDNEKVVFELESIAKFKFNSVLEFNKIPSFFYSNVIAIMFPYVRAFISTLTLQANTKLLRLDLMNLTSLKAYLIENTIAINN